MMSRSRSWSFTSFNLDPPVFDEKTMRYLCYGIEICPKTNKQHYQCYVQLVKASTLGMVKKLLGEGHYEPSKGDAESNIKYCSKDGNFKEFGEVSYQGKRNDLIEIGKMCRDKVNIKVIADEYQSQYIRYGKGIDKLHDMYIDDRDFKPNVYVYYGESGKGKTRKVFEDFKDVYVKPNGQWWDGYNYNETVLLDDYDGYINFREFLQLLDRYPHQVPYKGGFKKFVSKNICITSNISPDKWYCLEMMNEVNKNALFRRIDVVKKFV